VNECKPLVAGSVAWLVGARVSLRKAAWRVVAAVTALTLAPVHARLPAVAAVGAAAAAATAAENALVPWILAVAAPLQHAPTVPGRGLHSSTFQLNLSRFGYTSPCPPV
jgi:hypothetical protein